MERITTLTALKSGVVPADFRSRLGAHGAEIEDLVRGMVEEDEEKRLDCEAVRLGLEKVVGKLKG